MKKVLRSAAAIAAALAALLLIGGQVGLFSGTRPDNLGVTDGRLAPSKRTPNCVSSQADRATDPGHYIEPLRFSGSPASGRAALKAALKDMERVKIVNEAPNYLYAEFSSRLMGYVDDVEFYVDENAGVIHVRSASRLGIRDFGVNRERIETIRRRFNAALA
ncbi:MAG: DUF1499 domain-containing protein [Burkholderiales bacterium]